MGGWVGGWVGGVSPIQFFGDFFNFFNFATPPRDLCKVD